MLAQLKDSYQDLYKVGGLTLSVLSSEDVIQQSVSRIDEDATYKENGDPITHGINDDLMGTMDKDRLCKTCMGTQVDCPGHFGHIALAKPVYHGNLIDFIQKVLRCVCFNCSHLLADNQECKDELAAYAKLKNEKSRFNSVFKLSSNVKQCKQCSMINHKYRRGTLRIEYEIRDPSAERPDNDIKQILWPEVAQRILTNIRADHLQLLGLNKEKSNPANMIIENLAVAPPPVRPSVAMGGSTARSEDDLTFAYKQVIKQNNEIRRAISAGNTEAIIREQRKVLQFYVATVMDNDIQGAGTQKHKSGQPIKAIRARLKGKEGRLRGNLMGKRVDFSARSVITPDPNLRLDQLGVPREIAKNMTVPEVVTEHNMAYLRYLVDSGANNYPGAKYIRRSDGRCIDLAMLSQRTDLHLEIGYTVERHLQDGDYVIFNRQPSLHKMSMMGHRIRVLDYQTFRLNLSVTTPYNADFDGDEMNMHVPQSLETKAEIKEIMAVPRQVVAPQANKPCMGIVQDSLLGIMRLTYRDTFIDKPLLMNLLMFVDYDFEKGLPLPAIIKPRPLWTGKQIMSLVIPAAINFNNSPDYQNTKDTTIVIQNGELLAGILAKKSVGNSAGGIIHVVWKDLGPQACCDLLSNIQMVVNNWLVNTGFTVGVADIIAKPEVCNQVAATIKQHNKKVLKVIDKTQKGQLEAQPGKSMIESFEHAVNTELNNARNNAGRIVLNALSGDNRLKNMVNAGSKGSDMNISQIMACVGQQNVEGKRIPFGFSRRTLPHFPKDDFGADSRGFVANSYLIGLTPTEFYFHAMAGREGLIDTAVKTADTGYISRRLMKALEDVMVKYDGTVRTSKEMIVQFLYGEDGMSGEHFENVSLELPKLNNTDLAVKLDFLHDIEKESIQRRLAAAIGKDRLARLLKDLELRGLFEQEFEQLRTDRAMLRSHVMQLKISPSCHIPVNLPRLITNVKRLNTIKPNVVTDLDPRHYFKQMRYLQDNLCTIPEARKQSSLDQSAIIREAHSNATMLFKIFLRRYLCSKKVFLEERLDTTSFDQLVTNILEVFRSAIVHPGEMVGSIGAQSMGEPATQMTLNTFHNAGISSKNVTLGVPRLKEVINVAKTIKTPSLKVYPAPALALNQKTVVRMGDSIQHMTLSNLVSNWGIYFDPEPQQTIIADDEELIELHQATAQFGGGDAVDQSELCRWVLRFEMSHECLFNEDFQFVRDVGHKIDMDLNGSERRMEFIFSEDTMERKVIRIRPYGLVRETVDEKLTVSDVLRELAGDILYNITLRGFPEISKVSYTCSSLDSVSHKFDPNTGAYEELKGNWLIETDGVALAKVFAIEEVDATRTTSNNVIEIFSVLGIEAARASLIRELRLVLGTYDIYVNYRHISILVDVMTQRGILTAITRHGINRVDSGPLRKCSFEETAEILLEAAFFGEFDPLSGITENIIFGQLAPYGTGAFDLVVDRAALANCIEDRMGQPFAPYPQSSEHTGQFDMPLTPTIDYTPNPFVGQGAGGGGATSIYTPNPEGGFTPYQASGFMSPGSPSHNMAAAASVHDQGGYNSAYYNVPGASASSSGVTGKTPVYGTTPVYGYAGTPRYSGGYGGAGDTQSAAYSPNAASMYGGGASQHSSYSPTNVQNPYQTPSYSPTTPNYAAGVGITPIQHSTPTYNYGAPANANNAYQMPNLNSPSMNPASSASPMASMGSSGGQSSHVGYQASPSIHHAYGGPLTGYQAASAAVAAAGGTPNYHQTMHSPPTHLAAGVGVPGPQGTSGAPTSAQVAYNPEAKQDSSDSD